MRWVLFLLLLLPVYAFAQQTTPTLSKEDQALLDSLLKNDEFLLLLRDMRKGKSYFKVAASGGNSYFSIRNKRLNTIQEENKLVITPSLGYYHRSGLSLSMEAFLIHNNDQSDFYQYSAGAGWSAMNSKKVDITVSYTRFFRKKGFELITTPLENEVYVKINLSKPWAEPGISMGYADGDYTTYHHIDTVINGIRRVFNDTMRTIVNDFSISGYVQHYFEFYKLFFKKDGIGITPQFMLNAGAGNFEVNHHNPFITRLQNRDPVRFKNAGSIKDQGKFMLKSLALNIDANYTIGKFGLSPQLYFDYYLPETSEKRFTTVFSLELNLVL